MSSEYLGWTERKPPREFDNKRFDRDIIPGGPITQSFENYVRNIFRPNAQAYDYSGTNIAANSNNAVGGSIGDQKNISATSMLRMEQLFGKEALDDSRTFNINLRKALFNLIPNDLFLTLQINLMFKNCIFL